MRKIIGVTFLLIFVGVIVTIVGFLMSDSTDLNLFERPNYELTELSYEADEIDSFKMIFLNRGLEVYPSVDDKIKIEYYEAENDWIEVNLEGTKLDLLNRSRWYLFTTRNWWNIGEPNYWVVKVYLPEGLINYSLDLTTSNGSIEIKDIENINVIDLGTSNGAIRLTNVVSTGGIKADSSNGKVILTNIVSGGLIDLRTSNGDIIVDSITAMNLKVLTSNGSIDVDIIASYEDYRVELATSNGKTYIDGLQRNDPIYNASKTNLIRLNTSNGTIRLNFIQ
jgi:hypothetical protein